MKRDKVFPNKICNKVRILIDEVLVSSSFTNLEEEVKLHIQKCRICSEYLSKSENFLKLISNIQLKKADKDFLDRLSSRILNKISLTDTSDYREKGLIWLRWAVPLASAAVILALVIIFKGLPAFKERAEQVALRKTETERLEPSPWNLNEFISPGHEESPMLIVKEEQPEPGGNVITVKTQREMPELIVRAEERELDPLVKVNISILEPDIASDVMSQMTEKMKNEGYDINNILPSQVSEEDSYKVLANTVADEEELANMEEILIKGLSYDTGGYRVINEIEREETNETSENI